MILAGLPPTIAQSGTLLVTTLPAPMITWSPIDTPGKIMARVPIHTSFPIMTGFIACCPWHIIVLLIFSKVWFNANIVTSGAIITSLPIVTSPKIQQLRLRFELQPKETNEPDAKLAPGAIRMPTPQDRSMHRASRARTQWQKLPNGICGPGR